MSERDDNTGQTSPQKGRQPDYDVVQIVESMGQKASFVPIGALWKGQDGESLSGSTVHGRLLIKPRTPQEALTELRQETQASDPVNPSHGMNP